MRWSGPVLSGLTSKYQSLNILFSSLSLGNLRMVYECEPWWLLMFFSYVKILIYMDFHILCTICGHGIFTFTWEIARSVIDIYQILLNCNTITLFTWAYSFGLIRRSDCVVPVVVSQSCNSARLRFLLKLKYITKPGFLLCVCLCVCLSVCPSAKYLKKILNPSTLILVEAFHVTQGGNHSILKKTPLGRVGWGEGGGRNLALMIRDGRKILWVAITPKWCELDM